MKKLIAILFVILVILISGCTSTVGDNKIQRDMKAHIVEEYDPGTCYGMPGVVSEKLMQDSVERNDELSEYIKQRYGVTKTKEIYHKIQQFNAVSLEKNPEGNMLFEIKDGNCCTINHIDGKIKQTDSGFQTTVKETKTENVPC